MHVSELEFSELVRHHGTLALIGRFPTGGQGSGPGTRFRGDGLGSANSVTLSTNHRWLFVTNAGSNSLSVFRVYPYGLDLRAVVDQAGMLRQLT